MRIKQFIVGVVASCLLCGSVSSAEQQTASLNVNAKCESENGDPLVVFSISSPNDFSINTDRLPWFAPFSLTFIVMAPGGGEGLQRVYYLSSPGLEITTIVKGKIYTGKLILSRHYPQIREKSEIGELLFFWHWSPPDEVAKQFNATDGYGGWLLLPKAKRNEK